MTCGDKTDRGDDMYINNATNSRERCIYLAEYMLTCRATVRSTAANFGISKSTVHKDVTVVLKRVDPMLHLRVAELLEKNKNERHIRGGEATRKKYASIKNGAKTPINDAPMSAVCNVSDGKKP